MLPYLKIGYFADVIIKMRSYWIWVSPNAMTGVLVRKHRDIHVGRTLHDDKDRINKMPYIHTCYSATEMNEILKHATTRKHLQTTMLSERSQ